MVENIKYKKILKVTYGKSNIIDITRLIKKNINKQIKLTNEFVGNDPDKNKIKEMLIYFIDNTKYKVNENKTFIIRRKYNKTIKKNQINFGFIIIRYVIDNTTNTFWINCYNTIRKYYDNKIIIIDDNSNTDYLTNINLVNTEIINSEFPRRGEFLPYYYYYHNKFFDRAVIFHDGITVKNRFDFSNIKNYIGYSKLFSFENFQYKKRKLDEFFNYIDNKTDIENFHNDNIDKLTGCFGIMYVIDHSFLVGVQNKYNFMNLINFIDTRKKRETLERFSATLFKKYAIDNNINTIDSIFGNYKYLLRNKNLYLFKKKYGR
jgi:hypothetical protein